MDRIPDSTLNKIQAASGLAFSTYLALHLTNALAANQSQMLYDGVLDVFRVYYHHPVVEYTVIGGAVVVHVSASVIRMLRRWKRERQQRERGIELPRVPLYVKLHRYSGYDEPLLRCDNPNIAGIS